MNLRKTFKIPYQKLRTAIGNIRRARFEESPLNPFKENKRENKLLFFPSNEIHYKKMEERRKGNKREMEIRKNGRKEELQGFKHRVYGMDGVRKQTDSISCSLKRCVIKRVVDGKGIWIS